MSLVKLALGQVENMLSRASRGGQFETLVYHSAIDPKQVMVSPCTRTKCIVMNGRVTCAFVAICLLPQSGVFGCRDVGNDESFVELSFEAVCNVDCCSEYCA